VPETDPVLLSATQELSPYLFMLGGGAIFLMFVAVILMGGGTSDTTHKR
jgi:hypothetical protein